MAELTTNSEAKRATVACHPCPFHRLPPQLVVNIISKVAARSCTDLHSAKLTCRAFMEAAEDPETYRNASLPSDLELMWHPNPHKELFLGHCLQFGNLEAVFRHALRSFAKGLNEEASFDCLKQTASKGHRDATYVVGLKMLCGPDVATVEAGLQMLGCLRTSRCVTECRYRVKLLLHGQWLMRPLLKRLCPSNRLCHADHYNGLHLKPGRWILMHDDDEDDSSCQHCRWDYEQRVFRDADWDY